MTLMRVEVLANDEKTLAVITAHGAGKLTHSEIAMRAKVSRNTAYRSVKRLVHGGYVTRTGRGRAGSTYQVINAHD